MSILPHDERRIISEYRPFQICQLSADGSTLVGLNGQLAPNSQVSIFDTITHKLRGTLPLTFVALSSDGKNLFALSTRSQKEEVWNIEKTPRLLWRKSVLKNARVICALFVGNQTIILRPQSVEWHDGKGKTIRELKLKTPERLLGGTISDDGNWVLGGHARARLFSLIDGKQVDVLPFPSSGGAWDYRTHFWFSAFTFSPHHRYLTAIGNVCTSDSCLNTHTDQLIWDFKSRKRVWPSDTQLHFGPSFSPDGKSVWCSDGSFRLVDDGRRTSWRSVHDFTPTTTALSHDGRIFMETDFEGHTWIWVKS